jgi:type IV secretory pathway VirB10-like protein
VRAAENSQHLVEVVMTWSIRRISLATLAAALVAVYAVPASAQWAWRDESGRTVYSDRPPPASVKSDQILRQPSSQSFGAPSAQNAPGPEGKGDAKDAPKGPKTLAEREQEFRKRQQESAEAEKKQAEEQSRSEQKAAECERMRGYLKALEDGQRIARTDAQGNREFLDDAARAKEVSRVRDGMSRNCS